jgi:hypothetical protein
VPSVITDSLTHTNSIPSVETLGFLLSSRGAGLGIDDLSGFAVRAKTSTLSPKAVDKGGHPRLFFGLGFDEAEEVEATTSIARTYVLAEECRRFKTDYLTHTNSIPSVETLGFLLSSRGAGLGIDDLSGFADRAKTSTLSPKASDKGGEPEVIFWVGVR